MYRELPPPRDLAHSLACVWTSVARGGRILPDGCVDIVWDGCELVVAGPATSAGERAPAPGTPVFGVRFRLGAAGAGLGLPAEELTDLRVPLAELWPDGDAVREAAAARGLPGLIDALRRRPPAVADRLTRAAVLRLPGARVSALGDELGISERQLRRRFADAVGYGPKTLARILRFQRFLELATPAGDLARLAFDAGYADQAHLTRECRRLAGRTPAELVRLGSAPAGERLPWRG
jgi:AraC-like DNA-binding protein